MPVLGGSDEQDAGDTEFFLTCSCVKFCSQENIGRKGCIIMKKDRVAAFTDAVLAIIMTILVLELKKPVEVMRKRRLLLWIDVSIKVIGLILALTVYPPAMMYSVIIAAGMLMTGIRFMKLDWDQMQ